jgi:hypothetical protein
MNQNELYNFQNSICLRTVHYAFTRKPNNEECYSDDKSVSSKNSQSSSPHLSYSNTNSTKNPSTHNKYQPKINQDF